MGYVLVARRPEPTTSSVLINRFRMREARSGVLYRLRPPWVALRSLKVTNFGKFLPYISAMWALIAEFLIEASLL